MEMLSGAEMVIRALEDEGVEHIFGYPGGSVLDIYDALFDHSTIQHYLVRHEQAAVHMADGYTRSTGKTGVVLVTSGPGATNCITGIATAYADSIPMVVLSGQVPTSLIGNDAFQECDMFGISRPVVKHSFLCKKASDIPMMMKKAFHIAATGRPGPVVIDIPKDVQNPLLKFPYEYPEKVEMRSYQPRVSGHSGQIKKAVKTLAEAKKPILLVGGGSVLTETSDKIMQLVDRFNLPVTNTLMGLGAFPGTEPRNLGMLGMHGTLEANNAMHNSDLIISLGARFDDRVTNALDKFCPNAAVIHVDVDPTSISKCVPVHIPIVGKIDIVLDQMLSVIDDTGAKNDTEALNAWWDQIEGWRSERCLEYPQDNGMIKPQQVIEALYKVTDGDAFVTSDVGQHQMFGALYYPFDKPKRWINSGSLGTMGYGFPAAMGAQIANPGATVACISGDGSIQMNIQELSTCLQYDIPVKIILLNNSSLGMVKQWQKMFYEGRQSHSYMESMPDFVKLTEAYGHVGMQVENPEDLMPAMEKAFAMKDKLVFMNILVDPEEHVYPMQIKFGAMNDMYLSKSKKTTG